MPRRTDKHGLQTGLTRIRFSLITAVSLDGRITAGKREGSEWTSNEDRRWFQKELDRSDAVVMGRKTFDAIKRPLAPRNRIVFSSSPPFLRGRLRGGGSQHFLKNPTIQNLNSLLAKQNWHRIAVVGGTSIYDWFLRHGLVDEMHLTLEPVVFGSGKPLASKSLTVFTEFKLVSTKKLNSQGTLLLHYKK